MRIAAVFAALLAISLAGPVLAQTPAPAKPPAAKAAPKDAKAKDAKARDAKPSLQQLAQEGDPQAQYQLGLAYLHGKGVRRNPTEGAAWLALAAAAGRVDAALELAQAYEKGAGLRKDAVEAARWWFRAGRLGNTAARERFLEMFLAGETADVGGTVATEWLAAKAATGDVKAVLGMATLYEQGRIVPADLAEAERWYLRLALAGHAEARFRLGRMMLARPSLWRVPESEVRDGKWTGPTWYAAKPETDKHVYLGRPGMLAGEYWLTAAALQGHAEAQYLLATAKLTGLDLPFDLTGGVTWLQAAAENGHAGALTAIAGLAAKGQGFFGKDPIRAWVSYDLAAQLGRKDAEAARDQLAKTMSARQVARARQIAQDIREFRGL